MNHDRGKGDAWCALLVTWRFFEDVLGVKSHSELVMTLLFKAMDALL